LEQSSESSDSKLSKSEQELKKQVKGFLDILETKDLSNLNEQDTKEIEKTIQELKNTIDKLEARKTSLDKYHEYEEQIKKIKEKLKDKKELEDSLKELEDSLKKKKEERKKALQEAKQKFEKLKEQVGGTTGVTKGDQAQNQRGGGAQAWTEANKLGFSVSSYGRDGTDTGDFAKKVIEDTLKKIEEELKKVENKKE
ncbi:ErpL protein, partial [Borreliella garinii]